jgi:beta-galactosidase/beta-glucuronidase
MAKRFLLAASILCMLCGAVRAQVSFGRPVKINDGWKFILADVAGGETKGADLRGWKDVDLPHDWSVRGQLSPTLASCTGYLPGGIGWYRKSLDIPAGKKGEKIYLYFEGVYNRSEVWLNGQLLGKRPNGYISFMYDATPHIDFGGENTIAVRVDHSRSADSRWYTGSGIYRDVWMISADPVHISQWGLLAYPKSADSRSGVLWFTGFSMKSKAPNFIAETAVWMSA